MLADQAREGGEGIIDALFAGPVHDDFDIDGQVVSDDAHRHQASLGIDNRAPRSDFRDRGVPPTHDFHDHRVR